MPHSYKHLFFDLDRTLWDFETNSHAALLEIYADFDLDALGVDGPELFIKNYKRINEECWAAYRIGALTKEVLRSIRFEKTFELYGINDPGLATNFGDQYIERSPQRTHLFPNTHEVLRALASRYKMHIITNGFEEVQHIKLEKSDLTKYFDVVVTSEQVGVKKPDAKVFQFALDQAKASPQESLMIGDDYPVDIVGAVALGIDGVWFNPNNEAAPLEQKGKTIAHLTELLPLLGMEE